jgi:hypothetical protein
MTGKKTQSEFLNATEAREVLEIAPATFARLVKEGILKSEPNPLNKKEKLFRREDVILLAEKYKRPNR